MHFSTIKDAALLGAAAEAVSYAFSQGMIGYTAIAPSWALGAAGATAVVVDALATNLLASIAEKTGDFLPRIKPLLTHEWTQLALRVTVDSAASAAVAALLFGVAVEATALAPALLVGTLPALLPKVVEFVKDLLPAKASDQA